jgi:hypothetical protein
MQFPSCLYVYGVVTPLSTIFQLNILWQSVLLVEETRVLGENLSQVTDKLNHIMLYRVHLAMNRFELTMLVAIGTDCTGSFK